jgi:hypothetical protein
MQKLIIAAAASVALLVSPISVAGAASAQDQHHHRHQTARVAGSYPPYVKLNPAVRDGYIMNGAFDWRRLRPGQEMPWYAHGYSNDCVAWTPNAYHYACDPNNRY